MIGSRAIWALAISVALHAAVFRWGGELVTRQRAAPEPTARTEVKLQIARPAPEPPPPPPQVAAPPRPQAKSAKAAKPRPAPRPQPAARPVSLSEPRTEPSRPAPQEPIAAPVDRPEPAALVGAETPPEPNPRSNLPAEPASAIPTLPPPPPNPPAEEVAFPETRADYAAMVSSVRGRIDGAKRYPRLARRAGYEGRVLLKFRILPGGQISELRVLESSAYDLLDQAALRAVERAAPFAEQAKEIEGNGIEIVLPVIFQLR